MKSFAELVITSLSLPYQVSISWSFLLLEAASTTDTKRIIRLTRLFEYSWRVYKQAEEAWPTAGLWLDQGATGLHHAAKHHFDEIHYLDIVGLQRWGPQGLRHEPISKINIREIAGKYQRMDSGARPSLRRFTLPDLSQHRVRESYLLTTRSAS